MFDFDSEIAVLNIEYFQIKIFVLIYKIFKFYEVKLFKIRN